MKFNFFQALVPKDRKFFPLFEKASANLVEISRVLYEAIAKSNPERRKELIKEIENIMDRLLERETQKC